MENSENKSGMTEKKGLTAREPSGLMPEREIRLSPKKTGADFVLPDYMGDIRKLLNYSAKVLPSGRFITDEQVSFVGVVCYSVVYLDNENRLTEASFTSDYEYEFKAESVFIDGDSTPALSGLSIRPSAPRKLTARANLTPTVIITEDKKPPVPELNGETQILPSTVKESAMEVIRVGEREYAEEGARLRGVLAEDVQTVFCGGDAVITEAVCRSGELMLTGSLDLYALLMIDGETPLRVEKSIPISEVTPYECESGAEIIAEAMISSLRVTENDMSTENADSESDGEPIASVTFNATVEYLARAYGNRETTVALDAFSTEGDSQCKYREYGYSEFIGILREEIPMTFEVDRTEYEVGEIGDVLTTDGRFTLSSVESKDGEVIIEGDAGFTILMQVPDDVGYVSHKSTHHVTKSLKNPYATSRNLRMTPTVVIYGAETTLDNSKLYIKCKMLCEISMKEPCKKRIVEEMTTTVDKNEDESCGCITVYYPDNNDTLWEVAKKYRKSVASVAEENMLSADCLSNGGAVSIGDIERIIITKNIK